MKTTQTPDHDVFFLNQSPARPGRPFPWLAAWMTAGLLALLAPGAYAASVAADDASNYSAALANGNNGGTGFGTWTVTASGADAGNFNDASSTAISIATKTWGFFSYGGTEVDASRPFTGTLTNNQVFSVDLLFQGIGTGTGHSTPPGSTSAQQAGFELRNGSTARFRFYFQGGQSNCEIDDNAGTGVSIGAGGFPSGGFRVVFKLLTADTYELTVLSPNSGAAVYKSGTRTLMGTAGTGIDHVDLYDNDNQPNGGSGNCYFNSLKIGYDAPTISSQPASATAACQNTTASFAVTGNSTDGSTVSYAWRKRGSDWGKTWTLSTASANNGFYIGTPANGVNGHVTTTIGGSLWAIWAQTGAAQTAWRPLVSTLANNQSVSISMQHGNIQTATGTTATGIPTNAASAGFSLTDGSGNIYFAFQFVGGQTDYSINDSSSNSRDTGLPFSAGGENITFTLTSSTTYSCQITRLTDGSTTVIAGTLKSGPSGGIQRIYIWNNDTGASDDVFFNNLVTEGADDYGTNYTTGTWITGSDGGQKPLTDGTSGSASGYSGSATASFTITNAQTTDNANYDVAVMSGQGYTTLSSASALTVSPAAAVSLNRTTDAIYAGTTESVTATPSGGATGGNWTTSGTGNFSSTTANSTVYTPSTADITAGTVTLTFTTTGQTSPCGAATATDVVTIGAPNSTISAPAAVCSSSTGNTASVPTAAGATYSWTISGGTITAGSGTSSITFTANASGSVILNCTVAITGATGASSSSGGSQNTTITIGSPISTITAPSAVCSGSTGNTASVPTASGGTYTWTITGGSITAGTGTSSITFTANASGSVVLNCTIVSSGGCSSGGSQNQTITINPAAGVTLSQSTDTICSSSTESVTATPSGGATGGNWTSSGTGGFSSTTANATVYTPSTADITAGTVTLTFTTSGQTSPCGAATASDVVTIEKAAGVTLSQNTDTICSSSTETVTATPTGGATGGTWMSSGTGSFSNTNTDSTTYTPSAGDITAGTVTLTFTTTGQTSPCGAATATDIVTINSAPTISGGGQPSATTTCNGSSASFTVAASGTSPTYAWRQRGSGWGSGNGWTIDTTANSGTFIGASGKIDSSASTAFGLFANSGTSVDCYRPFGSLAVGQTIQVDIDNNDVTSGGPSVGFGIQNSAGQNLWEFFFTGGATDYTINDFSGANATVIPFTQNGIRITFELTTSTNYSVTLQVLNGGTTYGPYTGSLLAPASGTQTLSQLHFWNFNAGAGSAFDFFFNNLYVGGVPGTASVALYSDDAANYTALGTGNNFGQGPIANVLPGHTEFSGENTSTLTINPAKIANGDAANYDVVVYNSCGAVRSSQAALALGTTPSVAGYTNDLPANISLKLPITNLLATATAGSDTLVLTAVGASTNGVNVFTNSTFVFYDNTNNVDDQFTYTIEDVTSGCSASGTVYIVISPGQAGQTNAPVSVGTNGDVTVTFAGVVGFNYVVYRSTNLTVGEGWVPISTNTAPTNGLFQVIDDFSDLNGGVPVPPSTPPATAFYELKPQ